MNEKEKNKKMRNVRSLIDRVDNKILPLIVKRSKLVKRFPHTKNTFLIL